jgi:hypothetical protein
MNFPSTKTMMIFIIDITSTYLVQQKLSSPPPPPKEKTTNLANGYSSQPNMKELPQF